MTNVIERKKFYDNYKVKVVKIVTYEKKFVCKDISLKDVIENYEFDGINEEPIDVFEMIIPEIEFTKNDIITTEPATVVEVTEEYMLVDENENELSAEIVLNKIFGFENDPADEYKNNVMCAEFGQTEINPMYDSWSTPREMPYESSPRQTEFNTTYDMEMAIESIC